MIEEKLVEEPVEALMRDLLLSLDRGERPYSDVMSAWRTSCPRLPVWEEVNDRGLVARTLRNGEKMVTITEDGRAFLRNRA